jgi:hypothetical protein
MKTFFNLILVLLALTANAQKKQKQDTKAIKEQAQIYPLIESFVK